MANLELPDSLVSVEWLQAHLRHRDLIIFDGSWHMPATGRDARAEWHREHIPGARFFDFDGKICDPDSRLPHMLPAASTFAREVQALGLDQDSIVVVYDSMGMFSSPRVWWMLRTMGHRQCALLDGGLPAWIGADCPLESHNETPVYSPGNFSARFDAGMVADAGAVQAALENDTVAVLDARPPPRFSGEVDEPRPGLRRGHMPGAINLPFADMFKQGLLKPKHELKAIFAPLLAGKQQAIYSCGSGVTACVIAFAAHHAGFAPLTVYDGSWCEWGLPGDWPVVTD